MAMAGGNKKQKSHGGNVQRTGSAKISAYDVTLQA